METNRRIEISRRVYARLLYLYPQAHRVEYSADMLQVFTDQCRAACRAKKWLGFVSLWLSTLMDLGISVLREQFTSPHAVQGLLEAVPNTPLPWKGVALVLLPGLIFFVSQVAQLTGQDWFYLMVYRAAYYMILPVVVVWIWKRKFPIWGLVPLGLLCKTLLSVGYRLQYLYANDTYPVIRLLTWLFGAETPNYKLMATISIALLVTILVLLLWIRRRVGIPRSAWVWLGAYVLVMAAKIGADIWQVQSTIHSPGDMTDYWSWNYLFDLAYNYLYPYGAFLTLILLGALLARRHGRLAALLPLGYLLPTVIYGRVSNDWPNPAESEFLFMLAVGVTALVYRFIVALAGPLWIVRSATGQRQQRASAISMLILLAIPAVFNIAIMFRYGWSIHYAFSLISDQLMIGLGIALALMLYRMAPAAQAEKEEAQRILESAPAP